ncbi:lon peptidase n-terminal domain and ring finger protein c14f5.10c [Anaeramoeba ignava]|uniref:Lon peptidase n-terminal domain and ring finger protein c14f5.10c n=1 Tax=Anaeramoeba ignava TaxID=1746090 RepID=A0A9Q0L8C0_ANAIG|nr:lon peptidase n-terminal domain and ring finger protein c14f5.10c [Anaeramoeba ignava]
MIENLQSFECPICKMSMEPPITMCPNGHSFCQGCLSQWLERGDRCPICKTKIRHPKRNNQLEQLYYELKLLEEKEKENNQNNNQKNNQNNNQKNNQKINQNIQDEKIEDENIQDENIQDENIQDENIQDEKIQDENIQENIQIDSQNKNSESIVLDAEIINDFEKSFNEQNETQFFSDEEQKKHNRNSRRSNRSHRRRRCPVCRRTIHDLVRCEHCERAFCRNCFVEASMENEDKCPKCNVKIDNYEKYIDIQEVENIENVDSFDSFDSFESFENFESDEQQQQQPQQQQQICSFLLNHQMCSKTEHIQNPNFNLHPKDIVICPYLGNCYSTLCPYQHPNPLRKDKEKILIKEFGKADINPEFLEKIFFLDTRKKTKRKVCVDYQIYGKCKDKNCPLQHINPTGLESYFARRK